MAKPSFKKTMKRRKQRKDYEKKMNINKNLPKLSRRMTLTAGDGVLPNSRKFNNFNNNKMAKKKKTVKKVKKTKKGKKK